MATRKSLKNITSKDIERLTLDGKEEEAKVVLVHDGDTCDVVFDLRGQKERFVCRLLKYDAPELKEKPNGQLARHYLTHLVMGRDSDQLMASLILKEYGQRNSCRRS
jgi:endonuclease YncB( thermonuclease family)